MPYSNPNIAPWAKTAVRLLQGPVFADQQETWDELNQYQVELIQYFERIALEPIIDKRDGYAYLKQIPLDDDGATIGLVQRRPLTYDLSLVCVLLREWMDEFEASDTETANLYITARQFRERIELFFKEKANELKFVKELNRHLDQCEKMGFIKMISRGKSNPDDNRYEVKRIIKARITNEELTQFKAQLTNEFKPV